MPDRQKSSYPTAPIAWMSQAYDTPSSPVNEQRSVRSINSPLNNTSTITSLER